MQTLDIHRPGMPDLQFALLVTALCTSRLTALNHWLGDAREQVALLSVGLTDHTVLDPLDA